MDQVYPGLGSIARLVDGESRSISAENVTGAKGGGGMAVADVRQDEVERFGQPWSPDDHNARAGRELGQKWKVRPCIELRGLDSLTLMDVEGPGVIQHIWITVGENHYRDIILRFYWDGEEAPSVEVPVGDFFCNSWNRRTGILSMPINVNPTGGFNCFFPMPFRKRARVTLENRSPERASFFFTINYSLTAVGERDACFHAQFRRSNPLRYGDDYVILDGVRGRGQYVGTFMAWQQNNAGWWGEGEMKMFIDGDKDFPSICGTGTEDYFGGAWCFLANFTAPFMGYPYGNSEFGKMQAGGRHSLYRFHVMDPVRFSRDFKATIQALGWRKESRFLPLQDDISSVAYWYQTEPHLSFPALGSRNDLEIV